MRIDTGNNIDFYPRSPCGERRLNLPSSPMLRNISIHALLAESDGNCPSGCQRPCISIHALLAESDAPNHSLYLRNTNFYPRSPCGERRRSVKLFRQNYISIHALLAESDHTMTITICTVSKFLSTLSLRRATARRASRQQPAGISIHALLAESDDMSGATGRILRAFLSTLSLRRATAKVHKTVGHFCAYETNFMGIASSC